MFFIQLFVYPLGTDKLTVYGMHASCAAAVQDGVMQTGNVNTLKALTTAREISGALEYLHSQNVLHGDLNGNNILLAGTPATPGGQDQRGFTAKVADFGLSRLLSPGKHVCVLLLTHSHMSAIVLHGSTYACPPHTLPHVSSCAPRPHPCRD